MIEVTEKPIATEKIFQSVLCEEAGGVAHFIGTVRKEERLEGIFYESYPEMALKMLKEIAEEARKKWDLKRVAVVHRTGWVAVGEPAVVIALSAAHRHSAFVACQFMIDQIKEMVPIWKR